MATYRSFMLLLMSREELRFSKTFRTSRGRKKKDPNKAKKDFLYCERKEIEREREREKDGHVESFTGASDQVAKKFLMHHNGDVMRGVGVFRQSRVDVESTPICRYFREGFCRDGMQPYRHPGTGGSSAVNNSNNGGPTRP